MNKKIIICADDFGMSNNINMAIIHLLKKKIINATSCMSNMPKFKSGIIELKKIYDNFINVGIHLNLTEIYEFKNLKYITKNKKFLSIFKLFIRSKFRLINYYNIYNELKIQINNFIKYWNKLPDFIDGHHHIHHFPVIRKAIINLYKDFNMNSRSTYIRSIYQKHKLDLKSLIIQLTGAKYFHNMLLKNKIKHNSNFYGIYLRKNNQDFRKIILQAYKNIKNGGIIMCHPSIDIDIQDSISQSRVKEFIYFNSKQALIDQQKYNIIL